MDLRTFVVIKMKFSIILGLSGKMKVNRGIAQRCTGVLYSCSYRCVYIRTQTSSFAHSVEEHCVVCVCV